MPEARPPSTALLRRLLVPSLVIVLATDLLGGLFDVRAGRSSLASAWSSSATLCAPWPMIAFQVVAFLVIRRGRGGLGRVAAVLLTLACAVSVLSGFFDGQLGRVDLTAGERWFQVWLLVATGVLGVGATAVPVVSRPGASRSEREALPECSQPRGHRDQAPLVTEPRRLVGVEGRERGLPDRGGG